MRTCTGMTVTVLVAVLGLQGELFAQSRGMFGDRELGKPLKPRESRFRSGLEFGPSGNFLGRSTAERGTTFQSRSPAAPERLPLPPEAYYLEPEMVPGYLEDQARRIAAAQQRQQQQLQQLYERQQPVQQPAPIPPGYAQQPPVVEPSFPPLPPTRPDRYLPPPLPVQPGLPQPQPGLPGPTVEELQNSPDRWFRGAPTPTGPDAAGGAAGSSQRYAPMNGLGPAGSLGPSGVAGQPGLSRTSAATLGARLTQAVGAGVRSPISANIQGTTVILQGTVAAAADRQFAEQIAAMEPGVRRIDNRIRVEAAPGP